MPQPPFAVAHRAPVTAAGCAALQHAGATVFELDVQLAAAGAVVSHYLPLPAPLTRWERDNWRVRRDRAHGQDEPLAVALDRIPAGAGVLLDLKEADAGTRHRLATQLIEETRDVLASRAWFVSTDSPAELELLANAGFAAWHTARDRRSLQLLLTGPLQADGVSVRHTLLDQRNVARLRDQVDDVVAWTVNSTARARDLLDIGVTGITTDRIAVVEEVARDEHRGC